MGATYSVREFIRMTPMQKARLMKSDPQQYKKLKELMDKQFPKDSDPEALSDLTKNVKR